MTSLLDIAPSGRQITIRDKTLTIKGISAQGVVYLLNRFPLVRQIMTGHNVEDLSVETFMVLAPEAVNATIACGFGFVGTNPVEQEKAEEIAASFGIDEQVYALTQIMEVTLPYWTVFQFGKVIHGRPLLWIPLRFAADAKGVRARDYPGKLFRVNRKGGKAPLLLSAATKEPKYFAKPYVKIPKKFRVLEIARELSHKINDFYKRRMGKLRQGRR
jgi:hypothetical protein